MSAVKVSFPEAPAATHALEEPELLEYMYSYRPAYYRDLIENFFATHPGNAFLSVEEEENLTSQHYFGHAAARNALQVLGLLNADGTPVTEGPPVSILDAGSGLGSVSRFIADVLREREVSVWAVDINHEYTSIAREITRARPDGAYRGGRVIHVTDDLLEPLVLPRALRFDYAVSFLAFLHVVEKEKLFGSLAQLLKPGGRMFIEDYVRPHAGPLAPADALILERDVSCSVLSSTPEYLELLQDTGFGNIKIEDMTEVWGTYTAQRADAFHKKIQAMPRGHLRDMAEKFLQFNDVVAELFQRGVVGGVRIFAERL
eukprot:RCo040711